MRITTLLVLLLALCHTANGQSDAWNRTNSIGKGFNLAGWLEAGWLGDNYPQNYTYTKHDLQYLKTIGFQSVRMPMLFEWYADETPPYDLHLDHAAYSWIDSVITWTDQLDMNLLIVNHHGMDLTDDNYQSEIPRLVGLWKNIIENYDYLDPDRVFFELRNEPDLNITNENFATVANAIIDGIREINTTHSLIVGANWWNAGWSLATIEPYEDDNIIYTFHTYSPYDFTHQGFTWTGLPAGLEWPTEENTLADIEESMQEVKNWSTEYDVPVYLGEFGVSTLADLTSRCNWIEAMGSTLDNLEIPWIYWDVKHFGDSFGFFEDNILDDVHLIECFATALSLGEATAVSHESKPQLALFPNPTTDIVYANFQHSGQNNIQLFDQMGRLVAQLSTTAASALIDISSLSSGVYVCHLRNNGNVETHILLVGHH